MNNLYIGVDVGTGSARAALITGNGNVIKVCTKEIETWNPKPDFFEQSSDNIWNSCVFCIKDVISNVGNINDVKGLGFDATCSLVLLDTNGNPLSVSPTGNNEQNIILWMDHRASAEAKLINDTKHSILNYVGGKISLEMQMPKLLWLKNNMNDVYEKAGAFFDLPDFLTWKATNNNTRSLCSLVCKWGYMGTDHEGNSVGWNKQFLTELFGQSLSENNFERIGDKVQVPGTKIGTGLCKETANELGLPVGLPIGTSIIDAHSGALALINCNVKGINLAPESRLALICGTSTCHMAVNKDPIFVKGIWGPYYSVMIPNMWLNEGGQSATGKLIDHIISTHPATPKINEKLGYIHIQQYLTNLLQEIKARKGLEHVDFLTNNLHIWPDFHGNRSPIADPTLKGTICGLTLSTNEEDLAVLYLATIQALAYGTRHILETMIKSGYRDLSSIFICGGLSKNPLFVQTQADVAGLSVVCPDEPESVLLGAAMLAAIAAGTKQERDMSGSGTVVMPTGLKVQEFHDKKYRVFLAMLEHQNLYRSIMD